MQNILVILLLIVGAIIAWQDFKERLISLWAILLFAIINILQFMLKKNIGSLINNAFTTLLYFTFVLGLVYLFYFLKERKFSKIIKEKVGWGDIVLFIIIGLSFSLKELIFFFTIAFILAALIGMLKKYKTVPLAGILAILFGSLNLLEASFGYQFKTLISFL